MFIYICTHTYNTFFDIIHCTCSVSTTSADICREAGSWTPIILYLFPWQPFSCRHHCLLFTREFVLVIFLHAFYWKSMNYSCHALTCVECRDAYHFLLILPCTKSRQWYDAFWRLVWYHTLASTASQWQLRNNVLLRLMVFSVKAQSQSYRAATAGCRVP